MRKAQHSGMRSCLVTSDSTPFRETVSFASRTLAFTRGFCSFDTSPLGNCQRYALGSPSEYL